jgi:hypothetical protein
MIYQRSCFFSWVRTVVRTNMCYQALHIYNKHIISNIGVGVSRYKNSALYHYCIFKTQSHYSSISSVCISSFALRSKLYGAVNMENFISKKLIKIFQFLKYNSHNPALFKAATDSCKLNYLHVPKCAHFYFLFVFLRKELHLESVYITILLLILSFLVVSCFICLGTL